MSEKNKVEKKEIIDYLRNNLSIEIKQTDVRTCEGNYDEVIRIQLVLGDDVISEDSCFLPGKIV